MNTKHTISKNLRQLRVSAVGVVALLSAGIALTAHADNIQNFGTQSFEQIKAEYAGKAFVVSLWSIDCAPCRVELKMLGELKEKDPDFPLVVISTDSIDNREEAADILDGYGLKEVQTWMFADAFVERLRYSVDPMWHGELPRSYFFKADHSFESHSGVLTRAQLEEFFPSIAETH